MWFSEPNISKSLDNQFSNINELRIIVSKEKSIYETFDKMILKDNIFHAKLWTTTEYEPLLRKTLEKMPATRRGEGMAKAKIDFRDYKETGYEPPTHFKLNEFTSAFQDIVNTYGIPRYR